MHRMIHRAGRTARLLPNVQVNPGVSVADLPSEEQNVSVADLPSEEQSVSVADLHSREVSVADPSNVEENARDLCHRLFRHLIVTRTG